MGKTGRRGTGRYRQNFLSGTFLMFELVLVCDIEFKG